MSVYVIAIVRLVRDRKRLEDYWSKVGPTFNDTGSKPMSVYTPFQLLEGEGPVQGHVLIEFPDRDAAHAWYFGSAYQAVKTLREGAADIDLLLVESGVVTDPEMRMPGVGRH
jgi:uncharacterized protein (DUF1330 family)